MIIYNVTVSVEECIKTDWLNWMKTQHIPELIATELFTKAQINRVIIQGDSNHTFAIAYSCQSMKELHKYQIKFAAKLQQKHTDRYGDKAVSFRTIMEVIEEF